MSAHDHRPGWMGLLARAPEPQLLALWRAAVCEPAFVWVQTPETGMVTLRGGAGAVRMSFWLGDMTVTRCAVRLSCGAVGLAHVPGQAPEKARIAALCDALMQTDAAADIRRGILDPLAATEAARRRDRAAQAAATRLPTPSVP